MTMVVACRGLGFGAKRLSASDLGLFRVEGRPRPPKYEK